MIIDLMMLHLSMAVQQIVARIRDNLEVPGYRRCT